MSLQQLNEIAKLARDMGFTAHIWNGARASFQKVRHGIFNISVEYDHTRSIYARDVVYMTISTDSLHEISDMKEFSGYVAKLVTLAEKLKEIE